MGCDIHFFVERYTDEPQQSGPIDKQELRENSVNELLNINESQREKKWTSIDKWVYNDGYEGEEYWELSEEYYSGRDYTFFGILAGVRDGKEFMLEPPRGLPEDVSYPVKLICDSWGVDAHTKHYYVLDEFIEKWNKMKSKVIEFNDEYNYNSYTADSVDNLIEDLKGIDPDPSNIRMVFWFDN